MFFNFGAVARLPLVESNAIAFSSPLFTVALCCGYLGRARARLPLVGDRRRLCRRAGGAIRHICRVMN
jgi:hypothetical protein